jgi:virginiamycin B lyase
MQLLRSPRGRVTATLCTLTLAGIATAANASIRPSTLSHSAFRPLAVTITAYTVPTASSAPFDITLGPGGNLWFTEFYGGKIGSVNAAGAFKEYPFQGIPVGITLEGKGKVAFAGEAPANPPPSDVGFINAKGIFNFGPTASEGPSYFITHLGKAVWFSIPSWYSVGKLEKGKYTYYASPTAYCAPFGITAGPDGRVWFAEQGPTCKNVAAISPSTGKIVEYPVPASYAQPFGITPGPDGALWFTGISPSAVGRITTAGKITLFSLPPSLALAPYLITTGGDGDLWFTGGFSNQIGRMTTSGQVVTYTAPSSGNPAGDSYAGIAAGSGHTIWFTNQNGNQIDKLVY